MSEGLSHGSGEDDPAPADEARLAAFVRKIETVRDAQSAPAQPVDSHSGMTAAFRLVGGFVSAILIGVALGWSADHFFGFGPLGVLSGALGGLALGFFVLLAQARRMK